MTDPDTRSAAELRLARLNGEDVTDEQLADARARDEAGVEAAIAARRARTGPPTTDHPTDQARRARADRRN